MTQAASSWKFLDLDGLGAGVQLRGSPLQLALILIAPLAAVQQGGAI